MSYSAVSRTTTARPLSDGKIIMSLSCLRCSMAFRSSGVMLDAGSLGRRSRPMNEHADSARCDSVTFCKADSIVETTSGVGVFMGVTA